MCASTQSDQNFSVLPEETLDFETLKKLDTHTAHITDTGQTPLSYCLFVLVPSSKAVLLLWIFYVFVLTCVYYVCACLFIWALWSPAGKGLTSWLSFVVSSVSLSLSHWYPGSGVVLDCIDS